MPDRGSGRVLVKLRPTAVRLAAAAPVNLRPLYELRTGSGFGLTDEPQWFLADLQDGGPTGWDLAHARVADQMGVAGSDVLFAEPDLIHDIYRVAPEDEVGSQRSATGIDCNAVAQNGDHGQAVGPTNGWHLGPNYSQLSAAREAVKFSEPRTRIAHLDTGYFDQHVTKPRRLLTQLQHNFVEKDGNPGSAEDPDNKVFLIDNSGHGTGTIGILAGDSFGELGEIGGAPDAAIVPLRIADSVVLFSTSAFARALQYAIDCGCDVLSMSMGGLPSEAWREVVDRAYLAGLCMVTAAGNNFSGVPTRHVVYPARYSRVIAACGVMADGKPYTHLPGIKTMEGNYGPDKIMKHAVSAYTPNIPWAVYPCRDVVRWNGGGTSSATPQIAAAAALWYEKYKLELPRDWRRVEAVRKALFTTAQQGGDARQLGHGVLRAASALGVRPDLTLPQSKSDSDSWSFLRVMTGLGIAEPTPRERMFNLEIAQRWMLNPSLQELVTDPEETEDLTNDQLGKMMTLLIEDEGASLALRRHLESRYYVVTGKSVRHDGGIRREITDPPPACDEAPAVRLPPYRRLRVYATDPSLSARFETESVNEVTLEVPWEPLKPGPIGEYVKVEEIEENEQSNRRRPLAKDPGVDLDDPRLLAQDGWAPSEGNPHFHAQMTYAVAMKTIQHFERALGRPVLWRHRGTEESSFVQHLTIRPHAMQQANAFYSPDPIALQFGYFDANDDDTGGHVPGSRVYTCMSHDIIAHETTHAILDGMHHRFNQATNPDVLAFHEGFADIVALMQHFTLRDLLAAEIRRTQGRLESESVLGMLALQFGESSGGRGALRSAIGRIENGVWKRNTPDPSQMRKTLAPHPRGGILVAAIFDAFLAIYNSRVADLLRLATGGSGVLPDGAIHPDLVGRLADEASKSAAHVLSMCIRALDYLPPVDVTFFDYLRALITADIDLVSIDRHNYRVAFVEAFRRRGIYPPTLGEGAAVSSRSMSPDTLRWLGPEASMVTESWKPIYDQLGNVIGRLKRYAEACSYLQSRKKLFARTWQQRQELHAQLIEMMRQLPSFGRELGVDPARPFEIAKLARADRVGPDGRFIPQVIVGLTQTIEVPGDGQVPAHSFRGGSTLVVDLAHSELKYRILKNIASESRQARAAEFVRLTASDPLRRLFLSSSSGEPFAALHSLDAES